MIYKAYPPKIPEWLSSGGEDFEVVVFSEAMYVRNLADTKFPERLEETEVESTKRRLIEGIGESRDNFKFWNLYEVPIKQREYLCERFSSPPAILRRLRGPAILIRGDEAVWIAINTTDSLRFRVGVGGNNIETCYRTSRKMEEEFEERIPFAYSERYGFLSAHPSECGTGLILRFVVHTPGIVFTNRFANTRDELLKLGTSIKPMNDESMSADGHIFMLQNTRTLGIDEEELLANAQDSIAELVQREYDAREELFAKAKFQIEDKVMRGIGILTHARMISKQEGFALANALRFGSAEGNLNETIDLISATELYFVGQPAHIIKIGGEGTPMEIDTHRAELFRTYIKMED